MATVIYLKVGDGDVGTVELFDAEPSFDILKLAYPDARVIFHDFKSDRWTVQLGER